VALESRLRFLREPCQRILRNIRTQSCTSGVSLKRLWLQSVTESSVKQCITPDALAPLCHVAEHGVSTPWRQTGGALSAHSLSPRRDA